jgi:hypothetical protein
MIWSRNKNFCLKRNGGILECLPYSYATPPPWGGESSASHSFNLWTMDPMFPPLHPTESRSK